MYFQYCIFTILIIAFFRSLYIDINGRPAQKALGFEGVVMTILTTIIAVAIYYFAGAFDQIF